MQYRLGEFTSPRPRRATRKRVPTLSQFRLRFIEEYALANREKPSSIQSKESVLDIHLIPHLGCKPLDAIRTEDVQKLKAALRDRKAKTVNNILSVLSTLLKAAVEWELIEYMPCRIRLEKVWQPPFNFYDFADFERLVGAAERLDWRSKTVVLLGGEAGLRRGEMIGLEWNDIDLKRRLVTVQRSEWKGHVTLPKGGRYRQIPLSERLAEVLSTNRHLRGARVLCRDDGSSVTGKVLWLWVNAAQRAANLTVNGRLHVLRHTFCSHLAMRGAPTISIKELAGHTSLTTTMRYMHLIPNEKERAIRLLDDGRRAEKGAEGSATARVWDTIPKKVRWLN
jgi:integrase